MPFDSDYVVKVNEAAAKPGAINLAVGEPRFAPPKAMIDALKQHAGTEFGYTPVKGLPELREAIQGKLKRENGVDTEDVLVTAGAIEAIFDSLIAHLPRGSEALLFAPHYGKYATPVSLAGATLRAVGLKDGRPDMDAFNAAVKDNTKVIIHNSPANPSGIVFTEDETKRLAEIAEERDIVIVSDEPYEKFIYDSKMRHFSPGKYTANALTINSFSKTYGFPGLRIGYMAGRKELIRPAAAIHTSNTTCCPYGMQKAAVAALESGFTPPLDSLREKRALVISSLESAGIEFLRPQGAFYAYAFIGKKDEQYVCQALMAQGVLVMPGAMFGGTRPAVRICYTEDEDRLERGLAALASAIA